MGEGPPGSEEQVHLRFSALMALSVVVTKLMSTYKYFDSIDLLQEVFLKSFALNQPHDDHLL